MTDAAPPLAGGKALAFAWLVELVAVAMGLLLAVFAGLEGSDSGPVAVTIAIMPFVALSIIELTKIPLVGLAFQVRSPFWRASAAIALLLVTAATFENFVFGFERGFNERIRLVEVAQQAVATRTSELDLARTRLPDLSARQAEITARVAALRDEAAAIRQQARQDIEDVRTNNPAAGLATERADAERDLSRLDVQRDAALRAERLKCPTPARPNTSCNVSAVQTSYQRQHDGLARRIEKLAADQRAQQDAAGTDVATARQRRDAQLAAIDRERVAQEADLEAVRTRLADAQRTSLLGAEAVAQAERHRAEVVERSQLHRLADVLFGDNRHETIEKTKRLFVVSLAVIVALVGSLIAALHYAAQLGWTVRPGLIRRAIRAYVLRRRRALPLRRPARPAWPERDRRGVVRNLRGWLARRRRHTLPVRTQEVVKEVVVERLKLVFLPLDATEDQVRKARAEARRESA